MKSKAPPGKTKFSIPIKTRDGSQQYLLTCHVDEIIVPQSGEPIGIDTDYGVTAYVHDVAVYPTCDPMVYVNCESLYAATGKEAREIVEAAKRYGWDVS